MAQLRISTAATRAALSWVAGTARLAACVLLVACAATPDGERVSQPGHDEPGASSSATTKTPLSIEPNIVGTDDYVDPFIGVNRAVFKFNDRVYRWMLIPTAQGYQRVMPDPLERGVENFFHNIKMPIYAVNHLLQGEVADAGKNVLRFGVNSTLGLFGFFDPARYWLNLHRAPDGFANTLTRYGRGYGAYLVLPLLGPSDVRGGIGVLVDWLLNPIPHVLPPAQAATVQAMDQVQRFAPIADSYLKLTADTDDPYLFFRNLHLQSHYRDTLYRSDGR